MKKKCKNGQEKLKITFKQAKGVSEEEIQQKLNAVFDILFNEMVKKVNLSILRNIR